MMTKQIMQINIIGFTGGCIIVKLSPHKLHDT